MSSPLALKRRRQANQFSLSEPLLRVREPQEILYGGAAELTPGPDHTFYGGPGSWHGQAENGVTVPGSTLFVYADGGAAFVRWPIHASPHSGTPTAPGPDLPPQWKKSRRAFKKIKLRLFVEICLNMNPDGGGLGRGAGCSL